MGKLNRSEFCSSNFKKNCLQIFSIHVEKCPNYRLWPMGYDKNTLNIELTITKSVC